MEDVENQYNEAIAKAQEAFEDLKENGGGDLKDQIQVWVGTFGEFQIPLCSQRLVIQHFFCWERKLESQNSCQALNLKSLFWE